MSKDNLFTKKLKKQFLSVNNSIESFFNQINLLISKIKKSKFDPNSKSFLIFGIIVILIVTIFSIPSFYDKNIIQSKINNQISEKYKFDIKFNKKINFSLLPKPHFIAKDISVFFEKTEIAKVKKFKIFISNKNYFSFNDIKIEDSIISNAEFFVNKTNINFFKNLLFTDPNENNIEIKNSKVFYKNLNDDVLFITKIKNSKFFYDYGKLENNLIAKNEIFNLPFKLKIKNNYFNKKLTFKINSKKLRLGIDNQISYQDTIKEGKSKITLINKDTSFKYKVDNSSLILSSIRDDFYKAKIEFKPFYLTKKINYENLNLKNVFNNREILIELIRSEIFNNKNLNMNININVNNIINSEQLNNLFVNMQIIDGEINFSDSSILWKDDLQILLQECFLDYNNDQINLIGSLIFEFKDTEKFYSFFQVKKIHRKVFKNIKIDFVYNLDQNNFYFDNAKIDNSSNPEVESLIQKFNDKKNRFFNKITFKNFINDFFNSYSG